MRTWGMLSWMGAAAVVVACSSSSGTSSGTATNSGSSTGTASSSGSAATTIHCDSPNTDAGTGHLCVSASPVPAGEACPSGTNEVEACSTANLLGTCTLTEGGATEMTSYYSDGGASTTEAESACSATGGTWTAA